MTPAPDREQHDLDTLRAVLGRPYVELCQRLGTPHGLEEGRWYGLTEAPTPDMNMALVHRDDPALLAATAQLITDAGLPTMLMLAGDARPLGAGLPEGWTFAATMPIMTRDLSGPSHEVLDPRVRRATPDDLDVLTALVMAAFDIDGDAIRLMTGAAVHAGDPVTAWLLEEDGVAVSSVMTARDGDAVSLWTMSTPPAHTRRGYGRAVLDSVLAVARTEGATYGVLGATPAGLPLYASTGWVTVEEWDIHTNALSAQFAAH